MICVWIKANLWELLGAIGCFTVRIKIRICKGGISMWIISVALSIIFFIIGWIMVSKKKSITCCASVASLSFVALTLLMEYKLVLNWVNKEDWAALLDVVPTMFAILTGYVVIMFLANALLIGFAMKNMNSK